MPLQIISFFLYNSNSSICKSEVVVANDQWDKNCEVGREAPLTLTLFIVAIVLKLATHVPVVKTDHKHDTFTFTFFLTFVIVRHPLAS